MSRSNEVATTYKAREVEEIIDILFYRRVGYRVALAAKSLGIVPNVITIIGILIGMTAGHFFFYQSLMLNLIGMGLWVISNVFDSADGQLARMTGQTSEFGRILDGFGGNLVFFSMYFHICLAHGLNDGPLSWWVFPIALTAGACHALQSAMADYYRNAFLQFGLTESRGELHRVGPVREQYDAVSWRSNFIQKGLRRIYLNYTIQQEAFSPNFQLLRDRIEQEYYGKLPAWFVNEYSELNHPLLKYYNFLTINGRVLTLFFFILIGYPWVFFFVEITLFNLLLWFVLRKQESNNRRLFTLLDNCTDIPNEDRAELGIAQ